MRGGVDGLCAALRAARKRKTKPQMAEQGVIRGKSVVVKNKVYKLSIAIDAPLKDGDPVWVQFAEGNTAVVIGV